MLHSDGALCDARKYGLEVWRLLAPGGLFVQMSDESPEARASGFWQTDLGMIGARDHFSTFPRDSGSDAEDPYHDCVAEYTFFTVKKPLVKAGTNTDTKELSRTA